MKSKFFLTAAMLTGLSISANAADLAYKAPAYVPVAVAYSWTGFYIGGNLGGAWSHWNITDNFTGSSLNTGNLNGFMGGGQFGYNFQAGSFVYGVEFDFDWTGIGRDSPVVATVFGPLQASASSPWVGTIAARFGWATDRFLVYGKAGGGWVNNKLTVSNVLTGVSASASDSNAGWLVGLGVEYAVAQNWTVKLEYNHLGMDGWTTASPIPGSTVYVSRKLDTVKAGFNYKF